MKKLIALLTVIIVGSLLVPIASAGHSQRRIAGYSHCGDPIYDTLRCVAYDHCGNPIYRWVRDCFPQGCSRPGRCHYHGHAYSQPRGHAYPAHRANQSYIRQTQTHYVSPRVPARSSFVRRGDGNYNHRSSAPSRSARSSHSGRSGRSGGSDRGGRGRR